jgi:hypothetical protein
MQRHSVETVQLSADGSLLSKNDLTLSIASNTELVRSTEPDCRQRRLRIPGRSGISIAFSGSIFAIPRHFQVIPIQKTASERRKIRAVAQRGTACPAKS